MPNFKEGMRSSNITQSTDIFCNKRGIFIEFYHLPSRKTVRFKGFINTFQDTYDVSFDPKQVYGRNDPIAIFEGTKRSIQLAWTLVAETEEEAFENLRRAQTYVQMMYPAYKEFIYGKKSTKKFSASTLSTPPLLKMKFMNLISKQDSFSDALTARKLPQRKLDIETGETFNANQRDLAKRIHVSFGATGNAVDDGLLVIPGSVTMNPKIAEKGAIINGKAAIPYEIEMASNYTVLHEHDLGFNKATAIGLREEGGFSLTSTRARIASMESELKRISNDLTRLTAAQAGLNSQGNPLDYKGTNRAMDEKRRELQSRRDTLRSVIKQLKSEANKANKRNAKVRRLIRKIENGGRNTNSNFNQFPYGVRKIK